MRLSFQFFGHYLLSTCVLAGRQSTMSKIGGVHTGMRAMASETCTNHGPGPGKTSWAWGLRLRRVLSAPRIYLQHHLCCLQASSWLKCPPKAHHAFGVAQQANRKACSVRRHSRLSPLHAGGSTGQRSGNWWRRLFRAAGRSIVGLQ